MEQHRLSSGNVTNDSDETSTCPNTIVYGLDAYVDEPVREHEPRARTLQILTGELKPIRRLRSMELSMHRDRMGEAGYLNVTTNASSVVDGYRHSTRVRPVDARAHRLLTAALMNKNETPVSKLKEILEGFDDAMLMTKAEGQTALLRGRPMRIADVSDDSTLWFFTGVETSKVREVLADEEGYVILQKAMKQVVLHGGLTITKNAEKIAELWTKPLEVWFPKGPTDPNVCLMRFTPLDAEYWDNSGLNGVKYAWESAKAFMSGTTPQGIDRTQHAKLDLGRS